MSHLLSTRLLSFSLVSHLHFHPLLKMIWCPGNVTPSFYHYQHIATAQGLKSKPFLQVRNDLMINLPNAMIN